MRLRIPLLRQDTPEARVRNLTCFSKGASKDKALAGLMANIFPAKGAQLALENNPAAFRELLADWEAFAKASLEMEPISAIDEVIVNGSISLSLTGLGASARTLGLEEEADRLETIWNNLKLHHLSRKKARALPPDSRIARKAGIFANMLIPGTSRVSLQPAPLDDGDLKPGRLAEHNYISVLACLLVVLKLSFYLVVAVIFASFRSRPARMLAGRIASLPGWRDWLWIFPGAVLLPVGYLLFINLCTPLGGRDYSITSLHYLLPWTQFQEMVYLMVILTMMLTRWRLNLTTRAFGFAPYRAWTAWLALAGATVSIPLTGWAAIHVSTPGFFATAALLVTIELWLLGVGLHALFSRKRNPLRLAALSRLMSPPLAAGMLAMILLAPLFHAAARHWLQRDRLLGMDAAFPSKNSHEYRAAIQLRKEIRGIVGFESLRGQ